SWSGDRRRRSVGRGAVTSGPEGEPATGVPPGVSGRREGRQETDHTGHGPGPRHQGGTRPNTEGGTVNARIALVVGVGSGGSGRHVRSLGVGLAARGHRVAVVGPAETEREIGFTEAGLRFSPV